MCDPCLPRKRLPTVCRENFQDIPSRAQPSYGPLWLRFTPTQSSSAQPVPKCAAAEQCRQQGWCRSCYHRTFSMDRCLPLLLDREESALWKINFFLWVLKHPSCSMLRFSDNKEQVRISLLLPPCP